MKESVDVRIMKIVAEFDYLVKRNEEVTINELKNRAQFCPGIMSNWVQAVFEKHGYNLEEDNTLAEVCDEIYSKSKEL